MNTANTLSLNLDFWSEIEENKTVHNHFGSVWYMITFFVKVDNNEQVLHHFVFADSMNEAEEKFNKEMTNDFDMHLASIMPEQMFTIKDIELFNQYKKENILSSDSKLNFLTKKVQNMQILLA